MLRAFASPGRRDPARHQERPFFPVGDQVAHIWQAACIGDSMRIPVNVTVEDHGVTRAVLVHEHELLAELVLEVAHIAPRPPSITGTGAEWRLLKRINSASCTRPTITGEAAEARTSSEARTQT